MPVAVRAEGLSKRYRIPRSAPAGARPGWGSGNGRWDELWALRDANFTIDTGEVVGIIGRNGAGKSTLLKILGRITRPTSGRARVRGRLGTLLEVGTGFHPELTGRENIFLSGSILGMKSHEIRHKFDDIVQFAEIETFLETPVKRYSSGMYVRLAFAVAAYLEPEILLIDEVLAVGDVAFQKKCLSRMDTLSKDERTVLFVSHNMGAIRQLCPRSLLIDHGRIVHDGPTQETLRLYNDSLRKIVVDEQTGLRDRLSRCTGAVRFTEISVEDASGRKEWDFRAGDTIRLRCSYKVFEPASDLRFFFSLQSSTHSETLTTVSHVISTGPLREGDRDTLVVELPNVPLRPGDYLMYFWLGTVLGVAYDNLNSQNASFPPLTIWSNETDQHQTAGFFSIPARIVQGGSESNAPASGAGA